MKLLKQRSYVLEQNTALSPADFPDIELIDQLYVEAASSDVKALRQALLSFQSRPVGQLRLLVINGAEQLSELSQTTLLKTLEEPPSQGVVVVVTRSVEALLPTLRSRLSRLRTTVAAAPNRRSAAQLETEQLYAKERPVVVAVLEGLIGQLDLSTDEGIYRHGLLNRALRRLRQNVNMKLTLDWLRLNWDKEFGMVGGSKPSKQSIIK